MHPHPRVQWVRSSARRAGRAGLSERMRRGGMNPQMTWTAQLTYTARSHLDDIDAPMTPRRCPRRRRHRYGNDTGRLQITPEVEAPTLQDAADTVLRMTAAANRPAQGSPAAGADDRRVRRRNRTPPAMNLDVGVTESPSSRVYASAPGRPPDPGLSRTGIAPASGRLTRASVKAFHKHSDGHQTPGRWRRPPPARSAT